MAYIVGMPKKIATATVLVKNAETGKYVAVRGAGALKDSKLAIKRGVDLTKPIASQVLKGSTGDESQGHSN